MKLFYVLSLILSIFFSLKNFHSVDKDTINISLKSFIFGGWFIAAVFFLIIYAL
jgi:hypothetical protein